MNKGTGIGIVVGIAVVAIGAYAFFGIQDDGSPEQSAQLGMSEEAKVVVTLPGEAGQELPGEAQLGIKESAKVEVVPPEEQETNRPENHTIVVGEKIGFADKP